MEKPWYQSKTVWFNVLAFLVTLAGAFGYDAFTAEPWIGPAALAVATLVNVILRFITDRGII